MRARAWAAFGHAVAERAAEVAPGVSAETWAPPGRRGGVGYHAAAGYLATQDVSAETPRGLSAERRAPRPVLLASLPVLLPSLPALLAALLLGSPLAAQSSVGTTVDTTRATVGDRITLTVSVEHLTGAQVVWPDSLDLGPFEVVEARVAPSAEGEADGSARSTATFTLTAFELGALEIPGFEVEVVGPDGATEALATDAHRVEIVSVGVDESGEIRDIRGPLGIPMSLLRMLLLILGPLLLLALLYTVARRLRARDREEPDPTLPALERPAHESALEALAALEGSGMLERGQVKEWHIEVSDILRTYVERRFRVDALEMTTREVLHGLERAGVDESFREGLSAFLAQCDMVKFAKVRPGPDQSRQVLELGRRLVQRSAPGVEVPRDAGGASAGVADGRSPDALEVAEDAPAAAAGPAGGERPPTSAAPETR